MQKGLGRSQRPSVKENYLQNNYKCTIITKSGILYAKKLQDPSDHLQDRPGQPKQILEARVGQGNTRNRDQSEVESL